MGTAAPTRRLSLSLGSHTRQTGGLLPLSSPNIPVSSARATLSIVPLQPTVSTSPSLRLRAMRSITSSSTSLLPSALRARTTMQVIVPRLTRALFAPSSPSQAHAPHPKTVRRARTSDVARFFSPGACRVRDIRGFYFKFPNTNSTFPQLAGRSRRRGRREKPGISRTRRERRPRGALGEGRRPHRKKRAKARLGPRPAARAGRPSRIIST